jgi:cytochrome bd ubiquinol oxidase subunit II
MSEGFLPNLVAGILFGGIVLYATFGGADFGAGFWDLTAGGAEAGRGPRGLIDRAIGPVWEANHVWLIFCLVVMWTAFSGAFAAIMTTLYLPLGLAALGIVLRGSGFAFRKVSVRTAEQRANGAVFAASSVITPFFLGTVAGGIASGRVPTAGGADPIASWINPTSILGGGLAVVLSAYLAAVFLIAEARARNAEDLEGWFRRRARGAGVVAGAVAVAGILVLRADAHRLFDRLLGPGLPLVLVSAMAGLTALALLRRGSPAILRTLAVVAATTVVAGWGVAQYPYLLGTHLSIAAGAAPRSTLVAVVVVASIAAPLVVPSLGILYWLQQRGGLEGG